VVAGLIGLVSMNPQRSRERMAQESVPAADSRI
jgi:MFS transporter, ACS family, D-galactonate transporter